MFDGFDSLGRRAGKPVLQVVGGAPRIVEFTFDCDLLNHIGIIDLSGPRVKNYCIDCGPLIMEFS